jgi:hypothetical protein
MLIAKFRAVAAACYASQEFRNRVQEGTAFTDTGKVDGRKVRALLNDAGMYHGSKRYSMLSILLSVDGIPAEDFNAKTDPRMGEYAEWLTAILREEFPDLKWEADKAAPAARRVNAPADLLASLPGLA